jgi:hypothetical protein
MALFVPWHAMKPTYRGKPKDDAPPLNKKDVKRFSLMMRRYALTLCIHIIYRVDH